MGFAKLGFFFLVLLFPFHLLSSHKIFSQENSFVADFDKQQKTHLTFQEKSAVSKRGGGGGGGHGSGGGHGGSGGHPGSEGSRGNGEQLPQTQGGGGAIIPLYGAGAAGGGDHHRNNNHNHGSNNANRVHSGLNDLLCSIFMSLVFVYFV